MESFKQNISNKLRKHQELAIQSSINNDFSSGIHYHATGTGKSWVAMYIVQEFYKKYPYANVVWICERKNILTHQFSNSILKERGFSKILDSYRLIELVDTKNPDWPDSLNSSKFWGKPFLCVINRSYLTSRKKYMDIKVSIDLVIHDECHSIENKTTQEFYNWLDINQLNLSKSKRVIGFSATPEIIDPLDKIITKYSIYDAFQDKVILPPKILWLKGEKELKLEHLIQILQEEIEKLPYQKIIIWCGMIDECLKIAKKWKPYFSKFDICMDFNNINKHTTDKDIYDYDHFYQSLGKSILFCAVKHREGSDIPRIDGCVFMDQVEKRKERVFVQCMGRVLRKDIEGLKTYGLVIDLKAKSTIEICNRVQHYLKLENIFPWKYQYSKISYPEIKRYYWINQLDMVSNTYYQEEIDKLFHQTYSKEDIEALFTRVLPEGEEYKNRLDREFKLILEKDLFGNIKRALEILELTKNIPHVTRGSCGSSLICYLLGISHVDPVKYEISFARFLNQYRNNLPDIDFDFPHYLRDEVFLKLFQKWGNRVARISNHNYYHEKSALREAMRQNGIRKFISKFEVKREIKKQSLEKQRKILQTQKELEGQFRGFSLHCGGIIYFPDGIPENKMLNTQKSIIPQVNLNRDEVSANKNFKIDILSSRALSQLYFCHSFLEIDFDRHLGDSKTIELLSQGENIGLTLAESPLMRKALLLIKPKTIMDLAICLSIIRPAAKDARKEFEIGKYAKDSIIFDDDVIFVVSSLLNCTEDMADKLRRGYCKSDKETLRTLENLLDRQGLYTRAKVKKILENLRKYGFCKAHAFSYAQLVWQLAYQKAHKPKKFWKSTLKNIDTSYKPWVHFFEARCQGIKEPNKNKKKSIYGEHRNKKLEVNLTHLEHLKKYGTWQMNDDTFIEGCYLFYQSPYYHFYGLIANTRSLNFGKTKKLILFVGVEKHKYIEVIVTGNIKYNSQKVIVKGKGKLTNKLYQTIDCWSYNIQFI